MTSICHSFEYFLKIVPACLHVKKLRLDYHRPRVKSWHAFSPSPLKGGPAGPFFLITLYFSSVGVLVNITSNFNVLFRPVCRAAHRFYTVSSLSQFNIHNVTLHTLKQS